MIQFSAGGFLKKAVLGLGDDPRRALKVHEEMGVGVAAGVASALVGSPLELVMIQQQVTGRGTAATFGSVASPRHFLRGFVGTSVREGLWCCGFLSIPPIVRWYLRETYPARFDSEAKARVPASLLGGLFACYLTQPFDTVKTCMQGDIERKTFGTFTATAKVISKDGITAFYRGATFRYGRMVCAVFMMDVLQSAVGPMLYPSAFK